MLPQVRPQPELSGDAEVISPSLTQQLQRLWAKTPEPSALCFCRHLLPRSTVLYAHAAGWKGARPRLLSFRQCGDGCSARGKAGSALPIGLGG